jgi:hypothetical protein
MNLSDRAGALLTTVAKCGKWDDERWKEFAALMATAKKESVSTVLVRWLGRGKAIGPSFVACCQIIIMVIVIVALYAHPYNYARSDPLVVKSCGSSASRLSVYRCVRCIGSALPFALCLFSC